jgi:uncharacterized protein DUF4956
MMDLLGFDSILDAGDLLKLVVRFCINLAFIALVVRGVYLRFHPRIDFAFSCVLLNVMTFAVCMLLRKVPVELGFALGLFGVFGILRYRTDAIGTRDLTYLFVSVGLGMLNAIVTKKVSFAEVLFINGAILGTLAFFEYRTRSSGREVRTLLYDQLALLKPGRSEELIADLRERTGLEVSKFRIDDIDLLRDCARLTITCQTSESEASAVGAITSDRASSPVAQERRGAGAKAEASAS